MKSREKSQKASQAKSRENMWIVGIDEAGRGPLAGPVAVGLFLVRRNAYKNLKKQFPDFRDSKKLSEKKREEIYQKIKELKNLEKNQKKKGELNFCVAFSSAHTIDQKGINPSITLAILYGLEQLGVEPREAKVLLDGGLHAPEAFEDQQTIIKGDENELVIALASVTAKVERDRKMKKFGERYPEYLFEKHKGYGTKAHFQNLEKFGITKIHRRTFLRKFQSIDKLNK